MGRKLERNYSEENYSEISRPQASPGLSSIPDTPSHLTRQHLDSLLAEGLRSGDVIEDAQGQIHFQSNTMLERFAQQLVQDPQLLATFLANGGFSA